MTPQEVTVWLMVSAALTALFVKIVSSVARDLFK